MRFCEVFWIPNFGLLHEHCPRLHCTPKSHIRYNRGETFQMVLSNLPSWESPEPSDLVNFRSELQADMLSIVRQVADIRQRSEEVMWSVATLYNTVDRKVAAVYQRLLDAQSDESQVVVGHSGHRNWWLKGLKEAKKQIVCINPWTTQHGFDNEMIQETIDCLNQVKAEFSN